jgi:hypothetical protein
VITAYGSAENAVAALGWRVDLAAGRAEQRRAVKQALKVPESRRW